MTHSWPQWPAITIWNLRGREPLVTVEGNHEPPPGIESRAEGTWQRLRAENPRLFDGPILALAEFDPCIAHVRCRRTTYKWLSAQDELDIGVVLVAVNGVVTARDRAGQPHVLLGRRSPQNRMYGGMWELSPAGGVEPPPHDGPVPAETLHAQLHRELQEECGLRDPAHPAPLAFYRDTAARSFNVVFLMELARPVEELVRDTRPAHWDCDAAQWVARDEITLFLGSQPVIDASRALLAWLAWNR